MGRQISLSLMYGALCGVVYFPRTMYTDVGIILFVLFY